MPIPTPHNALPQVNVGDLTLEEKVSLLSGCGFNDTPGVPRLGLPGTRVCDSATDVRGSSVWNAPATAAFPNATALAATWDEALVKKIGHELAEECKIKNVDVLLAPTVNLHRDQRHGRAQESYGEDPFLAGTMATNFCIGLQENDTQACLKHLVCNDSDTLRREYDVQVDDQTFREIYLRPFEMVVEKSNPLAVMMAYNSVRGAPASHNTEIMDIVRKEWKYDGLFMSDWIGTNGTVEPVLAGMDLEMPFPIMRGGRLLQAIRNGEISEDDLTPRVENVLKYIRRCNPPLLRPTEKASPYDAERSAILRRTVADSIVLLKNEDNILPLDGHALKSMAVIGSFATANVMPNLVSPQYLVSPLNGIKAHIQLEASDCSVYHARGVSTHRVLPHMDHHFTKQVEINLWNGNDRSDASKAPVSNEIANSTFKPLVGRTIPGLEKDFEIEFKATFTVPKSATYTFSVVAAGPVVLMVDDKLVLKHVPGGAVKIPDVLFMQHEIQVETSMEFESGRTYSLHVVQRSQKGQNPELAQDLMVGFGEEVDIADGIAEAVECARKAEVAICFIGTGRDHEMEGFDREHISLSEGQEEMITEVLKVNRNVVLVNQSGGAVDLRFAQSAKALLHAHIGGQESGNGIADVIFGRTNPSGRLPYSFPEKLEDIATIDNFPCVPKGNDKTLKYAEGRCFGYRWHDLEGKPNAMYPFGYGLSYTTFATAEPELMGSLENGFGVSVKVTNTGNRPGRQVIQVYVSTPASHIDTSSKPVKTLQGFTKTHVVQPGSSERVAVVLPTRAFSHWSVKDSKWVVPSGKHQILVASSSVDVNHVLEMDVGEDVVL